MALAWDFFSQNDRSQVFLPFSSLKYIQYILSAGKRREENIFINISKAKKINIFLLSIFKYDSSHFLHSFGRARIFLFNFACWMKITQLKTSQFYS